MKKIDIRATIPRHKTRKCKKRNTASHIVVHTTASNNQDPNKTARYHVTPSKYNHLSKKGAPSICYHDFITKNGTIYHCVDYTDITWHAGRYNTRSIAVTMAFKGQSGESPKVPQWKALLYQLTLLALYLKIPPCNIIGHREVPGMYTILSNGSTKYKKTCPGMKIDLDMMRHTITGRLQEILKEQGLYTGKIDFMFGRKSLAALRAFNPLGSQLRKVNWKGYDN